MLLTLGTIPGATEVRYGDIRDRERADGTHWLQPELKAFFNTKLEESNETISNGKKLEYKLKMHGLQVARSPRGPLQK